MAQLYECPLRIRDDLGWEIAAVYWHSMVRPSFWSCEGRPGSSPLWPYTADLKHGDQQPRDEACDGAADKSAKLPAPGPAPGPTIRLFPPLADLSGKHHFRAPVTPRLHAKTEAFRHLAGPAALLLLGGQP